MYAVILIYDYRVTGGSWNPNLSRRGAQGKGNGHNINGHDHVPKCLRDDSGGMKMYCRKKGPTVLMILEQTYINM